MVIDNFNKISELLKFDSKDDFYFLQIIQRKKDGNEVPSANNGYRTIKTYYITSHADFEMRKPAIVQLCEQNNARAYINLNVRNAKEVALTAAKAYIDLVREDRCNQGHSVYNHACGVTPKQGVKKLWIVDVDTKDKDKIDKVCEMICRCRSSFYNPNIISRTEWFDNVVAKIPTVHGVHIITHGFDVSHFKMNMAIDCYDTFTEEEIREICTVKKDNPTLLYYKEI